LTVIKNWRPAVIVCDIGMPEEDGYSLIRKIRALPREDGGVVPALALTAFARVEDRIKVLSSGFQMHVAKPVQSDELITAIANLSSPPSDRL
jgi:CheY-like chemotaxis protein